MQETRPEDMTTEEAERLGRLRREFFKYQDENKAQKKMDRRLGQLNRQHKETLVRRVKVGRNEPCPCGSGRKFKKCCIHKATTC